MEGQNTNTQSTEKKSSNGGLIAIIGIIVIVLVGVIGYQTMTKQQSTTNQTQTQTPATQEQTAETTQPTTGETTTGAYKDGTYTAVGNYTSPGGQEEVDVTLTIANGVVTDSEFVSKATRPISKERQADFGAHYKDQVVGKSLDEIELGKVSGSSLTPKGFNDAVSKIKAEAGSQS